MFVKAWSSKDRNGGTIIFYHTYDEVIPIYYFFK